MQCLLGIKLLPDPKQDVKMRKGYLPLDAITVQNMKHHQASIDGPSELQVSNFQDGYNNATLKAGLFKLLIVN